MQQVLHIAPLDQDYPDELKYKICKIVLCKNIIEVSNTDIKLCFGCTTSGLLTEGATPMVLNR